MRWWLVFCAPLLAGLAVSLSCGSSVPASTPTPTPTASERTPIPPPTLGPIDLNRTPVPGSGPSGLTAEQEDAVRSIVRADPEIAEIVGDDAYDLRELGAWYGDPDTPSDQPPVIGGVITIALSQRIAHVEHDFKVRSGRPYYSAWPADAKAKYAPYTETVEHKTIDNLGRIHAFVDLQKNEVAFLRVETEFGQTVTDEQPGPTPQFTQGPSQEATDIFESDHGVSALLLGHPYTTADQYTFTYTIGTTHLASIIARFDQPQEIEGDWQMPIDFDQKTGAYTTDTIHFKATDVQSIGATIDLDKREVAWVEPEQHHND
jgi:hypothetical protein